MTAYISISSVDDVLEVLDQQQQVVSDLEVKVGATMNTVISLGDHVVQQHEEIKHVQNDVERIEERVDVVENDVNDTKVKVEEIDNKVRGHVSFSRFLLFSAILPNKEFNIKTNLLQSTTKHIDNFCSGDIHTECIVLDNDQCTKMVSRFDKTDESRSPKRLAVAG